MNEYNTEGRYLLIVCEKVFKIVYIKNLQKKKDEKEKQREQEKEREREKEKEQEREKEQEQEQEREEEQEQEQEHRRYNDKRRKEGRGRGRGRGKRKEWSELEVKVPILFIYRKSRKCYEKLVDKNKIRKKKKKYGNIINELIIDNVIGSVEIKNEFFLFVVEKWKLLNKFYYLNKYRSIYKIEKVYFVPYNINIMSMNTVVNNALNVDDSSNNFFINAFENAENIGKHFDIYDSSNSNNTSAFLAVDNDSIFPKVLEKNSDKSSYTSKNVGTVISNSTSNNVSATTFEPFDGIVNTNKVSFSNKVEFSDFMKYNAKENEKERKEEEEEFVEMAEDFTHMKKGKRSKHLENCNLGGSGNNLIRNSVVTHSIGKKEEKEKDRDRDKNKKLLTFNNAKKWLSSQFNHKNILNIISDITSYESKGVAADNEKVQRETKQYLGDVSRSDANWNPTKMGNEEMLESNICESLTEQKNEGQPQGSSRNWDDEIGTTYSNRNDCLNNLNDLEKSVRGDEAKGTNVNCPSVLRTEDVKNDNDSMNSNNNSSIYQNLFNRLSEGETPFSYGKVDGKRAKNESDVTGETGRKSDLNDKKSNYINYETSKNEDKRLDSKMDMHRILRTIQKLLTVHMYYSYDFDLTQSVQKKNIKQIEEKEVEPLSIHSRKENCNLNFCEKKFVWNFEMIKKLKNKKKIDNNWFCSIIQGYISYTSIEINRKRLELLLISRRSTVMGGTRFNKRGINDDGYVANFIETEQIIRINTNCGSIRMPQRFNIRGEQRKDNYSSEKNRVEVPERIENYNVTSMSDMSEETKSTADVENRIISIVQIRGSVPLFWEQHSMSSHVNIQRSALLSIKAFKEHNKKLIKNYGNNIFYINLLSEGKSNEKKLIKKIIELMTYIKRDKYFLERDYIHYIQYDFHTAVKNRGFEEAMNYFINKVLMKYIKQMSFYMESGSNGNTTTTSVNIGSNSSSISNSSNNNNISNSNKMNKENDDKNQGKRLCRNKGKYQEGIFRTNCLDCLDRTNVFQYYYCWFLIVHILNSSQNDFFLKPFRKSKLCFYRNMNSIFNKDKVVVLTTLPIDSYWVDFSDMYILDRKVEVNNKKMVEVQLKSVNKDTQAVNKRWHRESGENEDNAYREGVSSKEGNKGEQNETQGNPLYSNNRDRNMDGDTYNITFSLPQNEDKKENDEELLHIFKHLFKKMWVENGDAMSTHYTGTGSVFSSQVNFGKSSLSTNIDHAIKSIERFYQNNFEDNFRQECIDIILCNGKYKQQTFPQDNFEYFMNFRRRRGEHRSMKLTEEQASKCTAVEYSNHRKGRKKRDQEIKEKNIEQTSVQSQNEVGQDEKEGNDNDIKRKQEKNNVPCTAQKSDETSDSDESDSDDSDSDEDYEDDEDDENDCQMESGNEKDVEEATAKGKGNDNKRESKKIAQKNLGRDEQEKDDEYREIREYEKKYNERTLETNTYTNMETKDKKESCNFQYEEEPENVESSVSTSSSSSASSTLKSKEHVTEDDSVNSDDLQSDTAIKNGASRDSSKKKKMNEDAYDERIIKLWIGSWNLCGNDLYELNDISSWLNSVNELIDIYVFCFQEVVELTGFRVLMNMKDKYKEKKLEQKIVQSLAELSQRQKELYQKDRTYFVKREQRKRKFYTSCNYTKKNDTSEKGKNTSSVPFNADQNYFRCSKRENEERGRADGQQKRTSFSPANDNTPVSIQSSKGDDVSTVPDLMNARGFYNLYTQKDQMTQQKEKRQNTEIYKADTQKGKAHDILRGSCAKGTHEDEQEGLDVKHSRRKETDETNYIAEMEELQNFISKHKEADSNKIYDSHFLMSNVDDKWKEVDYGVDDDFTFQFAKRVEDVRNGDPFNRRGKEFEKTGEKRKIRGTCSSQILDECDAGTDLIWNKMKVEGMLEKNASHVTTRSSEVTDWKCENSVVADKGMKESESDFGEKKKCDNLKGTSSQGEKVANNNSDSNNNSNNNSNNINMNNNFKDASSSEPKYGCHFRKFKYVKLKSVSMIGLFILIFIDEGLIDDIREIESCKVKVGLKGNTGNKGSVSVKFRLGFNSFCFNNIHLASGQTNIFERNSQMQNILSNTFQNQDLNNVFTFDYFFACGDFNFRINKEHDEVVKLIEKNKIKQLLSYDQFIYTKMYNILPFCLFCEHPVSFNPTYKYKKNSNMYDVRRTPAWCDRILISGKLVHLSELEKKRKEFGEEITSPFCGVPDESYNMYQANINREVINSSDSEQRKYCEYMRDRSTRFKKERRSELIFREKNDLQKNRKISDLVSSATNSLMKHRRRECNENGSDGNNNQQYFMYNDFYENEKIYFNYESYKTHNNFFSSDHKPISAVINLKVFFDKTKQEEYDMMSSIAFQSFTDSNNMALYVENNDEDEVEDEGANDVENSDAFENNKKYGEKRGEIEKMENSEKGTIENEEFKNSSNLLDYIFPSNVNFTSYTADSVAQFLNYANEMTRGDVEDRSLANERERRTADILSCIDNDILKERNEDGQILETETQKKKNNEIMQLNSDSDREEERYNNGYGNNDKEKERKRKTEREKRESWPNLIDL